ncbi:aminoacyl-histidine dipeptidase [Crocinitomix algicola]|uniref:aminoacyl-histidine dipeptidase n=1 Tax=Crocinitomix algicola TaxID=1740263 RepID=UPI0029373979|nr:aminoacyl-histidine dipeptidase [Crocinitomix algicola]
MAVRNLEPRIIWNHFEDLNEVPRPSKKEDRVIEFMLDFGNELGLKTLKDDIGNVVIKKPATKGFEDKKTVILQSHLDMVHQKNNATIFDFEKEGIRSFIDNEWVKADGTTLGADNGMGVAAAMAILSSNDIEHPAIEALFTIDEETGMTGAKELDGQMLSGDILLNLDTEDDDEFSVGCAGGIDTNTKYLYKTEEVPSGAIGIRISVNGLKGGHSGMDIHLGRGNANLWMNRLVFELNKQFDLRIVELEGGSLRNAIPRESEGVFALLEGSYSDLTKSFSVIKEAILAEFSVVEEKADITLETIDSVKKEMVSVEDQKKILSSIYTNPNGVWKMSEKMEGIVETSSSLAKVIVRNGEFVTQSLQRSMIESGKEDIANALKTNYEAIGAEVIQSGDYPGWAPNPNSPILEVLLKKYREMFDDEPRVQACHAGLECGILSKHLPGCDMISFGPTIKNPHSPDEMVNIKSVQKFWSFLLEVLKNIPNK